MDNPIVRMGDRGLMPTSLQGLRELADFMLEAGLFPDNIKARKPIAQRRAEVMVMIAAGCEVGLTPIQSLDCICIVNGRPAFYGDALPALVHQSGLLEDHEEWVTGTALNMEGHCRVKRKGVKTEYVRTFSVQDANLANLWNRTPSWKGYPKRMLLMRARGFCFRDAFADVLKGLKTVEEVRDYPQNQGGEPIPPKPKEVIKVSKSGRRGGRVHWLETQEGSDAYGRMTEAFSGSGMDKEEANKFIRENSSEKKSKKHGIELVKSLTLDDVKIVTDKLEVLNLAKEVL